MRRNTSGSKARSGSTRGTCGMLESGGPTRNFRRERGQSARKESLRRGAGGGIPFVLAAVVAGLENIIFRAQTGHV